MLVVNAGPLRVGLMGVSEQEWSIATEDSSGANPVDLIEMLPGHCACSGTTWISRSYCCMTALRTIPFQVHACGKCAGS